MRAAGPTRGRGCWKLLPREAEIFRPRRYRAEDGRSRRSQGTATPAGASAHREVPFPGSSNGSCVTIRVRPCRKYWSAPPPTWSVRSNCRRSGTSCKAAGRRASMSRTVAAGRSRDPVRARRRPEKRPHRMHPRPRSGPGVLSDCFRKPPAGTARPRMASLDRSANIAISRLPPARSPASVRRPGGSFPGARRRIVAVAGMSNDLQMRDRQ